MSERWLPESKYDLVLGIKTEKAWAEIRVPRGTASESLLSSARDLLLIACRGGVDAHLLDDWHEDDGPALWWCFPVDEPPYVGTPLDSDWPGYHTHWTPLPSPPAAPEGAS